MSARESFDLDAAAAAWRADDTPPAAARALAARIRRHTLVMWLATFAEIAVLLALVAFTAWLVRAGITAAEIALLALIWLFSIGIFAFSLWNRRGSWRAAAEEPVAYIALIERRARAKLRAAYAVRVLVFVHSAVVVGFVVARSGGSVARGLVAAAIAAFLAAAYVGWSFWYAGRARAELTEAARLRVLLQSESGDDDPIASL